MGIVSTDSLPNPFSCSVAFPSPAIVSFWAVLNRAILSIVFFFLQRSDLCMVCACIWAGGSGVCTSFVVVVLVFLLNELASKPRDLPGSTSSSASSLTGLHRAIPSICVSPGIRTLVLKHS